MKYKTYLNPFEWELVAETFDFDKYDAGEYDDIPRCVYREAWEGNIPLFLHDVGYLDIEYIVKKLENLVTLEPIFSIFEKENLTFREMMFEIWERRKEIVILLPDEKNPYEDT